MTYSPIPSEHQSTRSQHPQPAGSLLETPIITAVGHRSPVGETALVSITHARTPDCGRRRPDADYTEPKSHHPTINRWYNFRFRYTGFGADFAFDAYREATPRARGLSWEFMHTLCNDVTYHLRARQCCSILRNTQRDKAKS